MNISSKKTENNLYYKATIDIPYQFNYLHIAGVDSVAVFYTERAKGATMCIEIILN